MQIQLVSIYIGLYLSNPTCFPLPGLPSKVARPVFPSAKALFSSASNLSWNKRSNNLWCMKWPVLYHRFSFCFYVELSWKWCSVRWFNRDSTRRADWWDCLWRKGMRPSGFFGSGCHSWYQSSRLRKTRWCNCFWNVFITKLNLNLWKMRWKH